MTELIELRPLKSVKSHGRRQQPQIYTTVEIPTESSDESSSSDNDSNIVFKLPTKSSKHERRKKVSPPLPIIINTQPIKSKGRRRHKQAQQFLINSQPFSSSPTKKNIVIQQIVKQPSSSEIPYISETASGSAFETIIERRPIIYQPALSSTVIEDYSLPLYDRNGAYFRRSHGTDILDNKTVHLPRHTKKLVNHFLSELEYAHGYRCGYGSDSDCSVERCRVCRRVRSVVDMDRRRKHSIDLHSHHRDKVVLEIQNSHKHNHNRSKDCDVCNLLKKSDIIIKHGDDRFQVHTKKPDSHIHLVDNPTSAMKPTLQTTTTTTTNQPRLVLHNPAIQNSTVPLSNTYYPTVHAPYVDSTSGLAYAYDPSWQYGSYASNSAYGYPSYYNYPYYNQGFNQYPTYDAGVGTIHQTSALPNQHNQTVKTTITQPVNTSIVEKQNGTAKTERRKYKDHSRKVILHQNN